MYTSEVKSYMMRAYGVEYIEVQISRILKSKGLICHRGYAIDCRRRDDCYQVLKNVELVLDSFRDDVIVRFLDEFTQRTDLSQCKTWGVGIKCGRMFRVNSNLHGILEKISELEFGLSHRGS